MKRIAIIVAVVICLFATSAFARHVNGYTRSDGTYVEGYERSAPNATVRDNYSYEGNRNPYTGEEGHNKYRNSSSSEYYDPYSSKQQSTDE